MRKKIQQCTHGCAMLNIGQYHCPTFCGCCTLVATGDSSEATNSDRREVGVYHKLTLVLVIVYGTIVLPRPCSSRNGAPDGNTQGRRGPGSENLLGCNFGKIEKQNHREREKKRTENDNWRLLKSVLWCRQQGLSTCCGLLICSYRVLVCLGEF